MPYEESILPPVTLITGADLSALQFHMCTIDSNGLANIPAAAAACVGVIQNKPRSGESATVAVGIVLQVVAGAAIAAGAVLQCDATGAVITRASGVAVGRALEAAAGSGVRIAVLCQFDAV